METLSYPGHEPRHILSHSREQFGMCSRTLGIPILKSNVYRFVVRVDFAFDENQVIRLDADSGPTERLHEAGHVASGVDSPLGSLSLQIADDSLQHVGNGRVFEFGK